MHKSKTVVRIFSCFLILSILLICYSSQKCWASGQDLYVDDDQRYPDEADGSLYNPFFSIQDAINAAQNGDTIKILPGNYYGDLVIDKSVSITTEDIEDTFITSSEKKSYMIDITADSVSLQGLTIYDTTTTAHRKAVIHISSDADGVSIIDSLINHSRNGYGLDIDGPTIDTIIRNNTFNDTRGINLENSATVSIYRNFISNCSSFPALKLVTSDRNHIGENYFENNIYNIYLSQSNNNNILNNTIVRSSNGGIVLNGGIKNDILNNTISDNNNFGIELGSSDGIVFGNKICNNFIGISIGGIGYNISDNQIYNCAQYGIYAKSGSSDNIIFNNSFTQKVSYHALEEGSNQWYSGNIGNYWDDFYGPNPNNMNNTVVYNNVIVPEVYKYKRGGVTDNYPKGIYQRQPEIFVDTAGKTSPSPYNLAEGVDRSPILSVVVTDPDPAPYKSRLNVNFYYLLNSSSHLIGGKNNIESGSAASISFSSTIGGKNAVYSYKGLGYGYIGVWYVDVEDSYSRITSPIWIFSTAEPPVNNTKPIINIKAQENYLVGDEVHAQINDNIRFDASGCYDPDGEIVFYRWNFGDGISVINEISPTHTYLSSGNYEVNLAVIDDDGSSNTSDITVVIGGSTNRAPEANINGPYNGYAGDSIKFSSSGSSDPDFGDSISNYYWIFGDGGTSIEQDPTYSYSTAGNYTVTLTVTDKNGETGTDTTYALINTKLTEESPGYEIILAFISILLVSIILKKRKR